MNIIKIDIHKPHKIINEFHHQIPLNFFKNLTNTLLLLT